MRERNRASVIAPTRLEAAQVIEQRFSASERGREEGEAGSLRESIPFDFAGTTGTPELIPLVLGISYIKATIKVRTWLSRSGGVFLSPTNFPPRKSLPLLWLLRRKVEKYDGPESWNEIRIEFTTEE